MAPERLRDLFEQFLNCTGQGIEQPDQDLKLAHVHVGGWIKDLQKTCLIWNILGFCNSILKKMKIWIKASLTPMTKWG